jgi:putative ABC transport system permease protein
MVQLDGASREVIGVLPPGFRYPRGAQIYKPFNYTPAWRERRGTLNMTALARLRAGVDREQVDARLRAESRQWNEKYHPGAKNGTRLYAVPLVEYLAGPLRLILLVLTGAVGLVLLIACANVASLQLVRASGRVREMAVRTAVGASRGRIVRQCLVESLVLAVLGGALGIVLGKLALGVLAQWDPAQQEALAGGGLDGRVLAFTVLLSMLAAVASGIAPAVRAARIEPQSALRQAGGGAGGDRAGNRFLAASVVVQVALAVVLLAGSGLMIRSLARLVATDPGFHPERVTSAQLALPASRYTDVPQQAAFFDAVLPRLQSIPGIQAAGAGWPLPFSDQLHDSAPFTLPGRPPVPGTPELHAEYRVVSPDYFRALGIPLRRGRTFAASDHAKAPMVVLVDENFARRFFRDADPVGREIEHAMGRATIVGVVGSIHDVELGAPGEPTTYYSYAQAQIPWMAVVVRTTLPPAAAAGAIRAAVRESDPGLPLYDVATMEQRISHSLGGRRLVAASLGTFAGVSLLLAVLGVYGLMRYITRQRTHEIGIRMALGARAKDVIQSVVGRGLALVGVGLVFGLLGAVFLTRLISGLLYGVRPTDPATFVAVILLMLATGFVASWITARHAARVDPMVALRAD